MRRLALVALVTLSAVACGADKPALPTQGEVPPAPTPAAAASEPATGPAAALAPPARPELIDIRNLGDLKARFDADQGKPRLVLLVSPT